MTEPTALPLPDNPRTYLIERFLSDAFALQERARQLQAAAAASPSGSQARAGGGGPDADTSQRMASACDDVVAMLRAIRADLPFDTLLTHLLALTPLLEQRAEQVASMPTVRSVYAGAALRIREVHAAERSAQLSTTVEDFDDGDDAGEMEE